MTLKEFNCLELQDQLEITWEKGVIEDHITYGDYYYILYKLYDFFVEIAFKTGKDDVIQVKSFS